MYRAVAFCGVLLAPQLAHAEGLELDLPSARAVARAGAIIVSDDGGAALSWNPAGIVRRGGWRAQVSMTVHDSDTAYDAGSPSPRIRDQADSVRAPSMALLGSHERWVFGAAYVETGDLARSFAEPASNQPADEVSRLFPHRYGGLSLRYQRRTAIAGAALRATDWLGLGASVSASQIELRESRQVWAGFDGRDTVGDPARDMRLTLEGGDRFVPGISLGALVAPEAIPLEFAASASWAMNASLSGTPDLSSASDDVGAPTAELTDPHGRTTLASPLSIRAGARYLGERFFVEVAGELQLFAATEPDPSWIVRGLRAVDLTGATGEFTEIRSVVDRRNRGALRGAVDAELVGGFLWLTGGYAYRSAAQRNDRMVPIYADLGGHTVAAGAEAQWEQITLTVGFARTLSRSRRVTEGRVPILNPFDAGSAAAATGLYTSAHDAFALGLEMAWD